MNIEIFYDDVSYRLNQKKKVIKLVSKVIRGEGKIPGDLNFIIAGDKTLLEINKEFLNHDYFTDVIAFGERTGKRISGEVYLSIETIRKNATNYKVSLRNEIVRVIIHGTLHLCGYEDSDTEKKQIMHNLEDKWLEEYTKIKG